MSSSVSPFLTTIGGTRKPRATPNYIAERYNLVRKGYLKYVRFAY